MEFFIVFLLILILVAIIQIGKVIMNLDKKLDKLLQDQDKRS